MPVTVLDSDGTGQDSDIIEGVVYAADNGADVILMAFSNPGYSEMLQAAIDYAWDEGVVLVAATGNDGSSTVTFPAGDRGVIGVSNTDQSDALNGSSNHGQAVFLGAPGTGIATTDAGGGTTSISGTSAAAAHVAGAAALVKAASGASNGVIVVAAREERGAGGLAGADRQRAAEPRPRGCGYLDGLDSARRRCAGGRRRPLRRTVCRCGEQRRRRRAGIRSKCRKYDIQHRLRGHREQCEPAGAERQDHASAELHAHGRRLDCVLERYVECATHQRRSEDRHRHDHKQQRRQLPGYGWLCADRRDGDHNGDEHN